MSDSIYESKEYKKSANSYNWECAFEYYVSLMVTDSLLATLLTKGVGMSDAMAGIVASFLSLAFLLQLLAVPVVRKISNTKRFTVIFHFSSQIFFMLLYLIPFLPFAARFRQILVMLSMLLAYFGNYFVTFSIFNWGNHFVDPRKKATFGAGKEMRSLFTGLIVQLLSGFAVDYFLGRNNIKAAFIFCAASIFVFSLLDLSMLLRMQNVIIPKEEIKKGPSFRDVLKNTLGKKEFRVLLYVTTLYSMSTHATGNFIGTYKTNELSMSLTLIQIVNVLGCLTRFSVSKPFGRFSDKTSYSTGFAYACVIAIASYVVMIVTEPSTWWLVIVFTLLFHASRAGMQQNLMLISYAYLDEQFFVEATALRYSISGIFGFLISLGCGKLLDFIQAHGNRIFGIHMYGQQLFGVFSLLLITGAMIIDVAVVGRFKK